MLGLIKLQQMITSDICLYIKTLMVQLGKWTKIPIALAVQETIGNVALTMLHHILGKAKHETTTFTFNGAVQWLAC